MKAKGVAMRFVSIVGALMIWAGQAQAETPTREDVTLVTVTEVVEAINHETREVTLRGPTGSLKQMTVGDNVTRLSEVKVGDAVTVDFFLSVAYELREPTDAEKQEPFVELTEKIKATAEQLPGGAALKQFRALCTIEGLDRVTETVTLKGPRGNYGLVAVKDPANLPKLRIGQSVVVTYTEALAISLEKPSSSLPSAPSGMMLNTTN